MDPLTPIRFELRRGAVTAIPLAIAVGLFGVSFGVLSATGGGLGALPAIVMSATTFAGSAQFAAASVVAGGGGAPAAIAAALLLNARYLPIGVRVARYLPGGLLRRFAASQLVVDESWAIASQGEGRFDPHRLVGAGVVLWLAWVVGTIIGVVGGEALGDPAALGLDAAFPALFLALLVPQLGTGRPLPPAVQRVVALLAPALLAALVATTAFGSGQELVIDARAAGLAIAAVAIAVRAPVLLVVVLAAAVAAVIRLVGGA